ncbi:hypothetical protein DVA79_22405, partial [Acinetobacter baumannii]
VTLINIFETRINACNISNLSSLCQISGHARATLKNKSLINIPLILLASSKSKIRLIAFVDY